MDFRRHVIDRASGTIRAARSFSIPTGVHAAVRARARAGLTRLCGAAGAGWRYLKRAGAQIRARRRRRETSRASVCDARRAGRGSSGDQGGAASDDRLIVNGLMRARPGVKVNAQSGPAAHDGIAIDDPVGPATGHARHASSHFSIDRPILPRGLDCLRDTRAVALRRGCRSRNIPRSRSPIINVTASIRVRARSGGLDCGGARSRTDQRRREHAVPSSERTPTGAFTSGSPSTSAPISISRRCRCEPAQRRPAAIAAEVRNIGVTVAKSSPDLMMALHLVPPTSRDTLFISNFANAEIKTGDPHRWRRLDTAYRQPRLFHAHLARSGAAALARPDRDRM